jgi:hypothetical protein
MQIVNDFITRARTVLTAAVTWILVTMAALQVFLTQATDLLGADDPIVIGIGRILTFLVALVAVIRRVTPAPAEERGLLPTNPIETTAIEKES